MTRQTHVKIRGDQYFINGQATYPGIAWRGQRIEGLLLNARVVQATFDDLNLENRDRWVYPESR